MGLKDLFRSKRIPFAELWEQVEGIPDGAKKMIPGDLSDRTKKKLEKLSPKEIGEVVSKVFEEINNGSVEEVDVLIRRRLERVDMNNKKTRKTINILTIAMIIVSFLVINIIIDKEYKHHIKLVADGSQYCYGIDSFEKNDDVFTIKGWFIELKSVQNVAQNVSDEDAELMLALVPLGEDKVGAEPQNGLFLTVLDMKTDRPDINAYFACEYDYSKCGFTATIDVDDLDTIDYRLAFKPDAKENRAILSSIYLSNNDLIYTDPNQSPNIDAVGTDLDNIVKEGVRLVSRPDVGCYIYQYGKKLYWITDDKFNYNEDGETYIEYALDTTQVDRLPADRIEKNRFWSSIGGCFEDYEITDKMNTGKYRVMVREIPDHYSVTYIITGYYKEKWIWKSEFKPIYTMMME